MFRTLPITMLLLAGFATLAPLLLFLHLYRDNREPFFRWWIVGWLLYGFQWVTDIAFVLSGHATVWLFASQVLAGLAAYGIWLSGRVYRAPVRLDGRYVVAPLAYAAWAGVVVWWLGDTPLAMFSLSLPRGLAFVGAGLSFHPRRGEVGLVGGRLLSAALVLWGVTRASLPLLGVGEPGAQLAFSGLAFLHFLMIVGVVMLVLDRRRQEMQHLKEFTDAILKSMAQGVAVVDRDFRIRYINRWMKERFPRATAGSLCFHVLDADGGQCRGCPWTGHHGSPAAGSFEAEGPDDQRYLVSYSPLRNPDGTTSLLEVVTDVTELHRLKTRLGRSERMAVLGQLAAAVTHELRNPLSAIANAVHVLGAGDLDNREARQMAGVVQVEVQRLNTILSNFLRYAKPAPVRPSLQDVNPIIGEVARLLRRDSRTPAGTKIHEDLDPGGARGFFDPDQIRQVVWNTAINGVEAMPDGGELRLSATADARHLRISMQNTGPGIPEDERAKIFEPFYSRRPGGTGLGLSIVDQIVRAHGGHITVECPAGGGVVFTVELPASAGDAA